ncbi:DUF3043 domain-containing protein [Jatrophihabitans telluris]|uniref:DUF3043 domain-containing protein n=1 Tax=Jatrophihabitans telluris TaxID=2038343 RepID=A0ABY4QV20_9ACTN|nr:DUF3043 domain-containing protein [Jatrophihabitans telluris]UQX87263.1 DUF3043 domain-containing protein [Jatrophihabitans telluris]
MPTVNLLRRKASPGPSEPQVEVETAEVGQGGKKGRPTPKRRTSSAPAAPAPKTRKEAMAWQKQQGKRASVAGQKKMTSAEYREAMRTGDPRVLPRRDAGPVRALARDWVDSHRMASNYLLLIFPIYLVGLTYRPLLPIPLLMIVLFAIEWILTGRRIKKLALDRGLQTNEGAFGLGFYAGGRAYFPRRWRRPAPRVSLGEQI